MLSVSSSSSLNISGLDNSHSKLHYDVFHVDIIYAYICFMNFLSFMMITSTDLGRDIQASMMEKALRSMKEKGSQ